MWGWQSIGSHPTRSINCRYHFVFITKYCKPMLRGEVGRELRGLIRGVCRSYEIEIMKGHIRPDHEHLLLSVPPQIAPSPRDAGDQGQDVASSPPVDFKFNQGHCCMPSSQFPPNESLPNCPPNCHGTLWKLNMLSKVVKGGPAWSIMLATPWRLTS